MPTQITVQQLLDSKGGDLYTIAPEATVFEALKVMSDARIGALAVVKEGKLVGMFSERDYARKIILEGKASKQTQVQEVMSSNVCFVSPEQTVRQCMVLMNKNRFRHLPVVQDDALVGVVSIGDIVRALLISLL